MINERGNTELRLDADEIGTHLPFDTADVAYLQLGTVEVHFDPSTREGRAKACEQLDRLRLALNHLESHLRVIRVAPEHVTSAPESFVTRGSTVDVKQMVGRVLRPNLGGES